MKIKFNNNQNGVVVLVTLLFTAFILTITLALSSIFIPKIKVSGDTKRSSAAIYAAESAIEWCLFINNNPASLVVAPTVSLNAPNNPTYCLDTGSTCRTLVKTDCIGSPITLKITGTYQGINRSYQVSF